MRDIVSEIRDIIITTSKEKKIKRTELAETSKMKYSTFRAYMLGNIKDIKLSQAQSILDKLGLELLIFEKDEQFNDKYDCKP